LKDDAKKVADKITKEADDAAKLALAFVGKIVESADADAFKKDQENYKKAIDAHKKVTEELKKAAKEMEATNALTAKAIEADLGKEAAAANTEAAKASNAKR
jgi:hypothetical protein